MSTQTTNLHLVKPSDNERADNDVINANMDTIDAAVGAVDVAQDGSLQSQIDALGESVAKINLDNVSIGFGNYSGQNVLNITWHTLDGDYLVQFYPGGVNFYHRVNGQWVAYFEDH